jgi:quercetin dioxygenase-like cupin family protein
MSAAAGNVRRIEMRQVRVLLSLFAVVLLGAVAMWGQSATFAQEATPGPEGLFSAPLGFASGVVLPSPADLIVVRIGIAPGSGFPLEADDPTGGMVVVQSGAFTFRVEEVAWTITRGAALGEALATAEEEGDLDIAFEEVAMGAEATLEAGDVAFIPGSVTGEVRNDGEEPAEALLFLIAPAEAMADATPTP